MMLLCHYPPQRVRKAKEMASNCTDILAQGQ